MKSLISTALIIFAAVSILVAATPADTATLQEIIETVEDALAPVPETEGAVDSTITDDFARRRRQCYWSGTAPLCLGYCGTGYIEVKRSVYGDGMRCWTGTKALCCRKPRNKITFPPPIPSQLPPVGGPPTSTNLPPSPPPPPHRKKHTNAQAIKEAHHRHTMADVSAVDSTTEADLVSESLESPADTQSGGDEQNLKGDSEPSEAEGDNAEYPSEFDPVDDFDDMDDYDDDFLDEKEFPMTDDLEPGDGTTEPKKVAVRSVKDL